MAERLILVSCAPLLLYVGYRLFALGIEGKIQLAGAIHDNVKLRLTNLSPGSFCFVLAIALGIVSFSKPLQITQLETESRESTGTSTKQVPEVPRETPPSTRDSGPEPTTKKTVSSKQRISFDIGSSGGAATDSLLSVELRRALSDLVLCEEENGGNLDSCIDKTGFKKSFTKLPNRQDLAEIEQIESRVRADPTNKNIKDYSDEKRYFQK